MLRSVPNKLLGVLAMLAGLLILLVLPATDTARSRGARFNPLIRVAFWMLLVIVFLLLYVGACHVADPWVSIGQVLTVLYFGYFLLLTPVIGLSDNTLFCPQEQIIWWRAGTVDEPPSRGGGVCPRAGSSPVATRVGSRGGNAACNAVG